MQHSHICANINRNTQNLKATECFKFLTISNQLFELSVKTLYFLIRM